MCIFLVPVVILFSILYTRCLVNMSWYLLVCRCMNYPWNLLCKRTKMQNSEVNLKVSDVFIFFRFWFIPMRIAFCVVLDILYMLLQVGFYSQLVSLHVHFFCFFFVSAYRIAQAYGGTHKWCGKIKWNGLLPCTFLIYWFTGISPDIIISFVKMYKSNFSSLLGHIQFVGCL